MKLTKTQDRVVEGMKVYFDDKHLMDSVEDFRVDLYNYLDSETVTHSKATEKILYALIKKCDKMLDSE